MDIDKDCNDWGEWSHHVLLELKRMDKRFGKLDDKMCNYNDTLLRLTITVEEHVNRTNKLEDRTINIEREVGGLHIHLSKLSWVKGLKPGNILKTIAALLGCVGTFIGILHMMGVFDHA